jgi:hypothetical protein
MEELFTWEEIPGWKSWSKAELCDELVQGRALYGCQYGQKLQVST